MPMELKMSWCHVIHVFMLKLVSSLLLSIMCRMPDLQHQALLGPETKGKWSHSLMDSEENRFKKKSGITLKMQDETQALQPDLMEAFFLH